MKNLLPALLFLLNSSAFGQVNYVLNPDFEAHTFCPTAFDQINAANFWTSIDSNYSKTSPCYPEYLNTCDPNSGIMEVPDNGYFWQYPRSGNGFAQMVMFYDETTIPYFLFRDYLQGRLYKKLTAGKSYCVTFYVNYEEGSSYAIKDIGAYLDNGSIDTTTSCGQTQTQYTPQVSNTGGIILDSIGWTKIEGSFIATGNEQFITIGNFHDKAHTNYIATPILPNPKHYHPSQFGLYLVDDVSVIESDLPAYAGPDTHVGAGDSVYIGRPKEVGLECTWSVLGSSTVIGTGGGIWVRPAATTSYVVTQTICGLVKKDTVQVQVWAAGVHSINGQTQGYVIAPNPNHGSFQISQSVAIEEAVQVSVFNTIGQQVHSSAVHFKEGKAGMELGSLPQGMYYLRLQNNSGDVWPLRFVRE